MLILLKMITSAEDVQKVVRRFDISRMKVWFWWSVNEEEQQGERGLTCARHSNEEILGSGSRRAGKMDIILQVMLLGCLLYGLFSEGWWQKSMGGTVVHGCLTAKTFWVRSLS